MTQRYIGGLMYNPPGGYSGYFDGSGDYLTGPSNSAFAFGTGNLTVEFWLFTLSTPGVVAGIYDVGTSNTSGRFVIDYYSDQKVKIETAGSTLVASSTNLPLNSWVHIAAVRSGTTLSLYQNGTRVGTATDSTNFSQNSPWVGQSLDGYAYNGYISNLRVVKGTAVYDPTQTTITVPNGPLQNITNTSLLTCRYPTFVDGSSNAFTITVNGNTTVSTQNPFPLTTLPNPAQGNAGNGIFSMSQYQSLKQQNLWPGYDPYFENVTLLLPGNGTNGAQNNTFLDSSSNNFTITRNGDTTQGTFSPFSQTGWSNYLSNATGSYIVAANNSSYVFGTGDFTVEFWVYWPQPSTSSETRLMAIGSDYPSSGLGLVIYRASGDTCKARVLGNSTGGTEYTIASGASDWANKWVHMAVTRSGSTLRTFLNGTLITSASNSSDLNGTNGIQFGRYTGGGDLFTGYLSNVRLTKGGALYTASFTPPTAPLTTTVSSGTVGFLGFQSNRFVDNSGNNITLTPTGTPSVEAFSPFNPTAAYSAATVGGSGYFDGSGDYLSLSSDTAFALGTGDFTWEGWLYRTASATQEIYTSMTTNGLIIYISGGAAVVRQFGVADLLTSSASITLNTWTHIAVARSGTTLSMWINGSRSAGGTTTNSTNFAQSGLRIGINDVGSSAYTGYISSLRVVKGTAVYDPTQTSITVPTAPLTNITNTSLLLNFTNAGIIDNTAKNDLLTVGNAQISTSVSKFGGGSMYFDGNGDYLSIPNTPLLDLGSGDFTIEFWYYPLDTSSHGIFHNYNADFQGIAITGNESSAGKIKILAGNGSWFVNLLSSGAATTNAWNHVAATRLGSTWTIWINGVSSGTATNSSTASFGTDPSTIGRFTSGIPYAMNAYIDDFRITKGIARYTSNFTPQTSQWQDQ